MDTFNVPKKVNRHVLKAINVLSDGKLKKAIPTMEILNQVIYQMRNLVPVANIDMVVQRSLKNLCGIGLIEMTGPERYALGHRYTASSKNPSSSSRGRKLNKANSRKRGYSKLNTNVNRSYQRDDSLSGDEFYRSPKRRNLPKARQQQPHHVANDYALDNPLSPPDIFGAGNNIDTSLNHYTVIRNLESFTNVNMEFVDVPVFLDITEIINPPEIFGADNIIANSLNRDTVIRDLESVNNLNMEFVDNVPVSLEITEITNDNYPNLFNQQKEDESPKKSEIQLVELYRNSKSISKNSSATIRPDFTINNSEKPSSGTVNSFSGTAEKSNLVVDLKSNDSHSKVN